MNFEQQKQEIIKLANLIKTDMRKGAGYTVTFNGLNEAINKLQPPRPVCKPLDWVKGADDWFYADVIGGKYSLMPVHDWHGRIHGWLVNFPNYIKWTKENDNQYSFEEAKAVAQSHYDELILGSLK